MSTIRVRRGEEDQVVDLAELSLEQLRSLQSLQSATLVTLKNRIQPYRLALSSGSEDLPEGIRSSATAARYIGHNLQEIQRAITVAKGGITCKPHRGADAAMHKAFFTLARNMLHHEVFEALRVDAEAVAQQPLP